MNDRTNNKTKIIFSRMYPNSTKRFTSNLTSLLLSANTMTETTIGNGAKEIWRQVFKPADQRQPTRQHDFKPLALDGFDDRCRDKFRANDQRSGRLRRDVREGLIEVGSYRTRAYHGYVDSKGFELIIETFA